MDSIKIKRAKKLAEITFEGGQPETGMCISYNKMYRTFCTCGFTSAKEEGTCPDCKKRIIPININSWWGQEHSVIIVHGTDIFLKKHNPEVESDKIVVKIKELPLVVDGIPVLESHGIPHPDDEVLKLIKDSSIPEEFYPNYNNFQTTALTTYIVGKYRSIFDSPTKQKVWALEQFRRICTNDGYMALPKVSDWEDVQDFFNIPMEVRKYDWNTDNLRAIQFPVDTFLKTELGKLCIAKVAHGSPLSMLFYVAGEWRRATANKEVDMNLFFQFVKENWDTDISSDFYDCFIERCDFLKKRGVVPTPDNVRNKGYYRYVNSESLGVDIDEIDPLLIVERYKK